MGPVEPIKVNKWDNNDLKNGLDDVIHSIMTKDFNYEENFRLIDTRLILCTLAVGVAFIGLIWDYLNPFPASKSVLIFCSISYFMLMGVLTWYAMIIEKNTFLIVRKKSRVYKFSSTIKKFDDIYNLTLEMFDEKSKKTRSATKKWSVTNFINEDGYVLNDLVKSKIKKLHDSLSDERKDK